MPKRSQQEVIDEPTEESLSELFAALADSTRRAMLARLADGPATVNELAEPFAISLQAISKHLKVLERAGLVSRSREAQWRPVRLEPARLDVASQWIQDHREMRLAQLDRLEQTVRGIQQGTVPPPTPRRSSASRPKTTRTTPSTSTGERP